MSTRSRRAVGALALGTCVVVTAFAAPQAAHAATKWVVARTAVKGGLGHADPLPASPGGIGAACVSLVGWTIKVTWDPVPHASGYTVYRSTSGSSSGFSQYATVGGGTTSYSDSSFSVLTSYWYKVTATVGTSWTGPQSASSPKRSISLLLVCT